MFYALHPFPAPLDKPSGRWGQTLCPIDPQTAISIGGQGARMQFCKDPIWKLCTGKFIRVLIWYCIARYHAITGWL